MYKTAYYYGKRAWNYLSPEQKRAVIETASYHGKRLATSAGKQALKKAKSMFAKTNLKNTFEMEQSTDVKRSKAPLINRAAAIGTIITSHNNERTTKSAESVYKGSYVEPSINLVDAYYPICKIQQKLPYFISDYAGNIARSIEWTGGQQGFMQQALFPLWTTSKSLTSPTADKFNSISLQQMILKYADVQTLTDGMSWVLPDNPDGTSSDALTAAWGSLNKAMFCYRGGHMTYRFQNTTEVRVQLKINEYTPKIRLTQNENPVACMLWDNNYNNANPNTTTGTHLNNVAPFNQWQCYEDINDLEFGPKSYHVKLHDCWNVSKTKVVILAPGDVLNYTVHFPGFNLSNFQNLFELKSTTTSIVDSDVQRVFNFDYIPLFSKFLTVRCTSELLTDKPALTTKQVETFTLNIPDKIDVIAKGLGQVSCCITDIQHSFRKLPNIARTNVVKDNKFNFHNGGAYTAQDMNNANNLINVETNQDDTFGLSQPGPVQPVYLAHESGIPLETFQDANGYYLGSVAVGNPSTTTALTTANTTNTAVSFGTAAVVPNTAFASAGMNTI